MIVESLYPEYANLYGDPGNIRYLQKCLPDAEFVFTSLHDEPAFATRPVDFLYMGPMSESAQEKAIAHLRPHAARLQELIESGTVCLFTGNAMEVLGEAIYTDEGDTVEGLGLLPLTARRDMMHRYAGYFKGRCEGFDMVGFKTQFTMATPTGEEIGFATATHGIGLNKQTKVEGVRLHNFFGTYLLGPVLVLNPPFTRYLLRLMKAEPETLPFEDTAMEAYRRRLKDFENM